MGQPDVLDRQRIEAHEAGGNGVDGDLIRACQNHVLDVRHHAARARAVAGERAVHDREHAAVNPLLNAEQVHQGLVNHRVRPMTAFVQEAAERILHRPGRRREHVRLDRGQVNDVLAEEPARNHEPVGVDLVQAQELLREVADRLPDVDPVLVAFVQVHVAQAVRLDDLHLLVLPLAQMRVDDDGAVVAGVDERGIESVPAHRPDDPFELPRRRRAARIEEVPGDVHLQRRVGVLGDDLLVSGQVEEPVVVGKHRRRARPEDRDCRSSHSCCYRHGP